jgi:hypothetical protein
MEKIPKKRGRKPKSQQYIPKKEYVKKEVPLIVHLPIKIESEKNSENNDNDIFLKQSENININYINELKDEIRNLENKLKNKKNKQIAYEVKKNDGLPCWWCRYEYNTPKVELPFKYQNEKFYTFGNFCSYECCEAYNIDLNDENVSKRSSLLKYQYYKTYNEFKTIKKAQDWKLLIKNGGYIDIDEFRKNFTRNKDDFYYLKPPIISRFANIEKIDIQVVNNTKSNELVLKRSKPLKTNKISLNKFIKETI